jgi:hypothetical protein
MTIEIHQPEIEALIEQRMASGAFQDVEEMLLYALKSAPVPSADKQLKKNFAQFLMDSPLPGSDLDLERIKDYPLSFQSIQKGEMNGQRTSSSRTGSSHLK